MIAETIPLRTRKFVRKMIKKVVQMAYLDVAQVEGRHIRRQQTRKEQ